jgi:PAS domain S-box-containing protein
LAKIDSILEETDKKFQFLVDNILDVIAEVDLNGCFTYISPRVYDVFGYQREEVIGRQFFSFIHPDDMDSIIERFKEASEGNNAVTLEYRVKHKEGHYINVYASGSLVKVKDRLKLVAIIRDITESKKAELMLRESEIKYRALFENSPNPILLLDFNGTIVDYNSIYRKTFGWEERELTDKKFYELEAHIAPDFLPIFKEKFKDLIKGKSIEPVEAQVYKKNREPIWTYNYASIVKLGTSKLIQIISEDVTERKRVERELREISQFKTELLERTSHELKTPLISIKGFTELLLTLYKEDLGDKVISILGEIKHGTEQLETIINKLLQTSILDSGKIQFNPQKEDLSFLIRYCIKDLQGLAKTRNTFIRLNIPNKLILYFEKERIYEVITHLIINAIKYTPPYGEISIETEQKDNSVFVSVKDNGIGLTEDEKKKIFQQFGKIERYGQGWNIGIEGTGMGLYTCKKIVELHGGEIWVESEGRNKGSKFSFSLPISKYEK